MFGPRDDGPIANPAEGRAHGRRRRQPPVESALDHAPEPLGSLLEVVSTNRRHGRDDIAIFEVGKGYAIAEPGDGRRRPERHARVVAARVGALAGAPSPELEPPGNGIRPRRRQGPDRAALPPAWLPGAPLRAGPRRPEPASGSGGRRPVPRWGRPAPLAPDVPALVIGRVGSSIRSRRRRSSWAPAGSSSPSSRSPVSPPASSPPRGAIHRIAIQPSSATSPSSSRRPPRPRPCGRRSWRQPGRSSCPAGCSTSTAAPRSRPTRRVSPSGSSSRRRTGRSRTRRSTPGCPVSPPRSRPSWGHGCEPDERPGCEAANGAATLAPPYGRGDTVMTAAAGEEIE